MNINVNSGKVNLLEYGNQDHRNRKSDYPDFKVPSGCAIFGVLNESGKSFNGSRVIDGITMMHERSNGLGGGFAVYGIYPEFADYWAFHILYDNKLDIEQTEDIIKESFDIVYSEEIPTKPTITISNPPLVYRYFLRLRDVEKTFIINSSKNRLMEGFTEENFIVNFVMQLNDRQNGAYIISSGKNMGIFKGVGFPEDIAEYFMLDKYNGYLWTSHGRFPTNSVGWWGGAHPFGLLDWSVVHNGEISSYGRNKRFVNCFGYQCSLSTDTEVICYLFDLLLRKSSIDLELISSILAAPLWEQIERMPGPEKKLFKTLRVMYGGALVNGPFSIIVGSSKFMYALNDRIKLRPMVAARKDDYLFVSSEESAIRKVSRDLDRVWHPDGGEPVIGIVKNLSKKNNGVKAKSI
jgi:glutamate synthase domain-containing protein 1